MTLSVKITTDLQVLDSALAAIKQPKVTQAQITAAKNAAAVLRADLNTESTAIATQIAQLTQQNTTQGQQLTLAQTNLAASQKALVDCQVLLASAEAKIAQLQAQLDAIPSQPVLTDETQVLSCPAGQEGAITQVRKVSAWQTTYDTCKPVVVEPPPVDVLTSILPGSGGSIVDPEGHVWSFWQVDIWDNPNWTILVDGAWANKGSAIYIAKFGSHVYAINSHLAITDLYGTGEVTIPPDLPLPPPPPPDPGSGPPPPPGGTTPGTLPPLYIPPSSGRFKYTGWMPTASGADSMWYGKHTLLSADHETGKNYMSPIGDGDMRLLADAPRTQSMQWWVSYDSVNGDAFERLTHASGDPADCPTYPFSSYGSTQIFNKFDKSVYFIPGDQRKGATEEWDQFGIKTSQVAYKYDTQLKKVFELCTIQPGEWYSTEHMGGAHDTLRNAVWLVTNSMLKFFDCATKKFLSWTSPTDGTVYHHYAIHDAALPYAEGIGTSLNIPAWCQEYNPVTDQIIGFDAYRGLVVGIPLSGPNWNNGQPIPQILARVPALLNQVSSVDSEPIDTIETGFAFSVKFQTAFVSYAPEKSQGVPPEGGRSYVEGGVGGVWTANVATGAVDHTPYPDEALPLPAQQQWTACEFNDFTETLYLLNNIVDSTKVWGARMLKYKFAAVTPEVIVTPAWAAGMKVGDIRQVPNSTMTQAPEIDDLWFADIGLPVPSQRPAPKTGLMTFTANSKGVVPENINDRTQYHNQYKGYAGMAVWKTGLDSILLIGEGDSSTPQNNYHGFHICADNPFWTKNLIKSTHSRNFKYAGPPDAAGNYTFPAPAGPGESDVIGENYDGSPRSGHEYCNTWTLQIKGNDVLVRVASNQYVNTDQGSDPTTHTANLATGLWEVGASSVTTFPMPEPQDERPWKCQHPVTEDLYMNRGYSIWVYRKAKEEAGIYPYEQLIDLSQFWGQWPMNRIGFAVNWEDNYLFCEGWTGSGFNTRVVFTVNLTTGVMTPCTLTGELSDIYTTDNHGTMLWVPGQKKFLVYTNNTLVDFDDKPVYIYSITRVAPTVFSLDKWLTNGIAPPVEVGDGKLGGMLTKFALINGTGLAVIHLRSNDPMWVVKVS